MIKNIIDTQDLLWQNISELPYFRGFLRSIEGSFFRELDLQGDILDLGCGDGHFTSKTLPGSSVQGIDPAFFSLKAAKKLDYFSGLICSNGDDLPFQRSFFQTIISNSVLEHIPDVDSVINETARILKKGGKFIISVPNSNFTENLSIALFFERLNLKWIADNYRKMFNWISRHHHPDPKEIWLDRLRDQGFIIKSEWNYFPPEYLKILEWGHFFGLPTWVNFKLFGRWILNPSTSNFFLKRIYFWLYPFFIGDSKSPNGAYTFIVAEKQ